MELLVLAILALLLGNFFLLIKISGGKQRDLEQIKTLFASLEKLEKSMKDDFSRIRLESGAAAKESREELSNAVRYATQSQTEQIRQLTAATEERLDKMRQAVESQLKAIQQDNSLQLEKMRHTVDEKLHKTLEQRLGDSFKLVSERLELVHKGLGEMQNLASGVGDLKKVLSNVKTRGILGEIQLENILEQVLAPNQYDKNVATKQGSRDRVEFALKLPGKDGEFVYLPIDAKFPLEIYYTLLAAYDNGDVAAIEAAGKELELVIKKCAKDIRDKYIDTPNTTDFALLFLPIEGLYAEVVRRAGLLETLQREYRINITGPTTLAAFLNSLQMGFKTLAIERHSSEVWQVLGAVKTEFEKFGGVLAKAQDRLAQASKEIDSLVGVRTRQIQRKLSSVQSLPTPNPESLLGGEYLADEEEEGA